MKKALFVLLIISSSFSCFSQALVSNGTSCDIKISLTELNGSCFNFTYTSYVLVPAGGSYMFPALPSGHEYAIATIDAQSSSFVAEIGNPHTSNLGCNLGVPSIQTFFGTGCSNVIPNVVTAKWDYVGPNHTADAFQTIRVY